MARIYDFASRKPLNTRQDTEANETIDGKYAGNIGKQNAAAFRSTLSVVESLVQRISDLTDELDDVSAIHLTNVEYVTTMLKLETFDMEAEDLLVGEDGHVWVVKAPVDEL